MFAETDFEIVSISRTEGPTLFYVQGKEEEEKGQRTPDGMDKIITTVALGSRPAIEIDWVCAVGVTEQVPLTVGTQ
jgi:hypothetical protein